MRRQRLGRSTTEVTELGFGGGPLGGLFEPLDDATAAGALAAAWDAGVRYYDTSPHYGIGTSERRTGAALRARARDAGRDAGRDGFTVSTKVGRLLVEQDAQGRQDPQGFQVPATHRRVWDFTRDGVRRSLEDSLARTGLDRVDALYLHDAEEHFEDALREGYPALDELRAEGVVGAIGAGMYDPDKLTRLVRETDVDVVMLSGRYTLLNHTALDTLFPACAERGVSVLAASVFNSGLLATAEPGAAGMYDYAPAPPGLVDRARRIAGVCAAHGVELPAAALAFPLRHPVVAGIVVGMRSADEVRANVASYETEIPEALWSDLRDAGLLDERTP
ncbi:aldo/keto reductase [Streptomyces boncukensis]|uniref:Aldo/keto reductase n=1 Tax=Streptomyces boncukensis TaxID=2711219 RepID=A0A6G4X5K8_9ACTN|nr:aldo/keto reductase [Streptomyces boncukensis]NGO72024.1 aldo/keto reductase [Streptomyces boncukensis]